MGIYSQTYKHRTVLNMWRLASGLFLLAVFVTAQNYEDQFRKRLSNQDNIAKLTGLMNAISGRIKRQAENAALARLATRAFEAREMRKRMIPLGDYWDKRGLF